MEANRKPRNTALTPEQMAEARDAAVSDAAALTLLWQGKFDDRIKALRAESALVAAGRSLSELVAAKAAVEAEIATATASRDAVLAEGAQGKLREAAMTASPFRRTRNCND
jgi:adenylosuccinate synthase